MNEIGGYIEFEKYDNKMLYENGIKLNCGRSCLAYIIEVNNIKEIYLPKYNCYAIEDVCKGYNIIINYYDIEYDFLPKLENTKNKWVYIINYFGQISNKKLKDYSKHNKIIVDNAQAYFQYPLNGIPTIYTCRKFFGVTDGGILFSNKKIDRDLKIDFTSNRVEYLIGRFECGATKYYEKSKLNNLLFDNEGIKKMSKFTENLLHSFNYKKIRNKRTKNFSFLNKKLKKYNKLNLKNVKGAYMYPLLVPNADKIRKDLISKKIFIPILWPNVLEDCDINSIEYDLAKNILPIPCDQRYGVDDMKIVIREIKHAYDKCLNIS